MTEKNSIPEIGLKGISQEGFADAFAVLEECLIEDVPAMGCEYPFFAPGGAYGPCWWNIDSSVALVGYRRKNRTLAENAMKNFFALQKEDGRIPLWGYDRVKNHDEDVSSLPKIVSVAALLARESEDEKFIEGCYALIARYLGWWKEKRFDEKTGLYSAVFEETFPPHLGKSRERAAADTNSELIVCFARAAELARRLGKASEAERFEQEKRELADAVNRYLWDEEKGAYYPYLLQPERREDFLVAAAFLPLRENAVPEERAKRLVSLLTGEKFGWKEFPVCSAAKDDKQFAVTEGEYQYNASWSGSVWTLLNEAVVQGLKDSGFKELAAELAWRTVREFHANYAEFLQPFNGSGHGVKRYAWTASQYIELVLDVIFGISADAGEKRVTVSPLLCGELQSGRLHAKNVRLPDGGTLSVEIENGKVIKAETADTKYAVCVK